MARLMQLIEKEEILTLLRTDWPLGVLVGGGEHSDEEVGRGTHWPLVLIFTVALAAILIGAL